MPNLRNDVEELLIKHSQSVRNHRCACGWRPEASAKFGSEELQHRSHVADAIVGYLDEWYE